MILVGFSLSVAEMAKTHAMTPTQCPHAARSSLQAEQDQRQFFTCSDGGRGRLQLRTLPPPSHCGMMWSRVALRTRSRLKIDLTNGFLQ